MTIAHDSRLAGLLDPVFALGHTKVIGVGDTLAELETIDFCAAHSFAALPIHETIGDPSPYNPISSRGLSPALLSLTPEEVPGLSEEMIEWRAPESWRSRLREGSIGTYGNETWNERLEMPVYEFSRHTLCRSRSEQAARLVRETGRILPGAT